MIDTFTGVIGSLIVYPERMKKNLQLTHGLIYSQPVLLALTGRGMKREDAYAIVQKYAMEVWESGRNFEDLLKSDPAVANLIQEKEFGTMFDPSASLKHVDEIFKRVGLS